MDTHLFGRTLLENYKKCRISIFEFWHFPPIFVVMKLTCLVTSFDRKLQIFKNSSKWTFLALFINFCPFNMYTQLASLAMLNQIFSESFKQRAGKCFLLSFLVRLVSRYFTSWGRKMLFGIINGTLAWKKQHTKPSVYIHSEFENYPRTFTPHSLEVRFNFRYCLL